MAFEYVRMVEFFECLDLALEHLLLRLALDGPDVDDLNGYFFLGFVVGAAVDHRTEAAADDVLKTVGIILYFLAHVVGRIEQVVHSKFDLTVLYGIDIIMFKEM